jgi:hypothetical protein
MPAEAPRDSIRRPVPWRRMSWVTWRLHRLTLGGLFVVLGVACVYLYFVGEHLRAQGFVSYGAGPGLTLTAALFQVIPPLIGAFVGAPVLARELETGTFRFTWTQGFGRARWAIATLTPLALIVTVLAGAFGSLFSWAFGPQIGAKYGSSPIAGLTFDLRDVAFAGWVLFAFAIGVLAGIVLRRVVAAMFTTMVAWSAFAVITGAFLRRHYEAPLVTRKLSLASTDWKMSSLWTRDGHPVSSSIINNVLEKVGVQVNGHGQTVVTGSPLGNTSPTQYLIHHGFTQLTSYQPASRFWPFQWIEAGWLLALALLLMAGAVWMVHRRAA